MIFVTVGTTMPFASLLEEVDRLVGAGELPGPVICQTGASEVDLKHCESFKFRATLEDLYQQADLVITHGGSTVFSLLSQGKRFIAFPNPIGADQHQLHVLKSLSRQVELLWSEDVRDLAALYRRAQQQAPAVFAAPRLGDEIKRLLGAPVVLAPPSGAARPSLTATGAPRAHIEGLATVGAHAQAEAQAQAPGLRREQPHAPPIEATPMQGQSGRVATPALSPAVRSTGKASDEAKALTQA